MNSDEKKKLVNELEGIRTEMETMLEDESILSLPKAFRRMKGNFDSVLQGIEDGDYDDDEDSDGEAKANG